jgi:ABC-type transport system substrate-binding protein
VPKTAARSDLVINAAMSNDPDQFYPGNTVSAALEFLAMNFADRLTAYDQASKVAPSLAESWTASSDARVWTFKLKTGVVFHDGTPFNAEAVKANFDRILDPAKPARRAFEFSAVASIRVVDDNTIEFTTKQPFVTLPSVLAIAPASIVSPKSIQEGGDKLGTGIIATGPFKLAEFRKGDRVVMQRNDNYWGSPVGPAQVVLRIIPDAGTRAAVLETGEADVAETIAPSDARRLRANPSVSITQLPSLRTRDVKMCVLAKPLDDVRVRQAIYYAIDREEIVRTILEGAASVGDSPVPPGAFGYVPIKQYAYDPTRAKQLLADAGLPNGFKVNYWVASGTQAGLEESQAAVQAQLRAVGIEVNLQPMETTAFIALSSKGPDEALKDGKGFVSTGSSANYPDAYPLLVNNYHSGNWSPKGSNRGFYKNARVDELIDKAGATVDSEQRLTLFKDIQRLIVDEAPTLVLWYTDLLYGNRANIQRMVYTPNQHMLFANATKG